MNQVMDASSIDIKYNETLSARLKHLVGNKICSDLLFVIEDTNEEIPAHKLIVALASPVLHKIVFGNETFPPSDIITVDGISRENFMEILLYIYTDRISLSEDNVIDIFQKSNYFGLTGIESKCLQYFDENLSVSTVPWIFHQLFFSASSDLLNKCKQYIRFQPLKFFASEDFETISIDELKSVFKLDAINCTEVDLFEAMIRLSRAHCAAAGLEITAENQRKILDGTEKLLRLESLTEEEFDKCLAIQRDFYFTAEVDRIRADIRNAVTTVRRKWCTFQDAVWTEHNAVEEINRPASAFYTGLNRIFIYRCCKEGKEPQVASHYINRNVDSDAKTEILCGTGYKWRKCVNGEIPLGAVPISLKYSEPVFIARRHGDSSFLGRAYMNGTMTLPMVDHDIYTRPEFDILVAENVKNPYTGSGAPSDAIFIGCDDHNYKTYLGRAWSHGDLLPAKIVCRQQCEAFVSYGGHEVQVTEFDFVRMDPGTYRWEQGMDGEVPENAVIAGCTVEYENLYFGRTMHHGYRIPGKVHQSHGVLYVPFRGQELNYRSYEVLVHVRDM
ncbi:uncharacterized protein LOC119070981 [Bradysia coprophila]|uniref:uncharacterized protein LOC119070981 n=1 Tax=Bradysia coprophila TaxID=38358 RepID=UPI00187D76F9|nr:uncharacterized protein LOC119070981 [Bradysia coprophila]